MTGLVGSLADTPLAQVFRRIVSEERSGDLQVTLPDAIKTVYFDRGFVVFASSNRTKDRLGESMVDSGRISKREFDVASELMKASRVKFGKALVSSGIVSEEELGHYVAGQVNRIVLSLFSAKRGVYSFDERSSVIPMDIMVSLSVYRILLEGIRHMTSKKLVLTGLPSLDADLQVVDQPPFALDLDALRPVERSVLKTMSRGPTTIRVVIDQVGGNEGVVLRAVYGLIAAGVLELSAEKGQRPLSIQMETGTFVLSELSQSSVTAPATVIAAGPAKPPAPSPEPVAPKPSPPEPSRQAAPRPAAAAAVAPGPEPAEAGVFDKLRGIFDAVLAWLGLGKADEPLGIAPARGGPVERGRTSPAHAEPPPSAAGGASSSEPVEPVRSERPAQPETVGVPSWSVVDAPEAASPVEENEATLVPDWSVTDSPAEQFRDFFEELGVPFDSEPEPPPPSTPPVRVSAPDPIDAPVDVSVSDPDFPEDDAPSMFAPIPVEGAVPAATDMLDATDEVEFDVDLDEELEPEPEPEPLAPSPAPMSRPPEPRSEPIAATPVSSAPPEPPAPAVPVDRAEPTGEEPPQPPDLALAQARRRVQQAGGEARLVRDVKLHFKLRDWQGAVPLLEQLVEISPGKAVYHGMLGRALSRHPGRRKEAEAHFVEALRISPRDAELHYWLGLYYKSFGLGSRAANEFKTTLRINPRHEGARRQLGGRGKPDDALGSVLKKLFG